MNLSLKISTKRKTKHAKCIMQLYEAKNIYFVIRKVIINTEIINF